MKKNEFYRLLSNIEKKEKNYLRLEQYETDIDTAYNVLNTIDKIIDIKDKTVADLGCGNGILGISFYIFGARNVDMYDIDKESIEVTNVNIRNLGIKNSIAIQKDIFDINKKYDIIISNPPFGFQSNFSIEAFVKKALIIGKNIFFIYKDNMKIRKFASDNNLSIIELGSIKLKKTQKFHKKDSYTLPIILIYKINL